VEIHTESAAQPLRVPLLVVGGDGLPARCWGYE
jgi:hypothetical protein